MPFLKPPLLGFLSRAASLCPSPPSLFNSALLAVRALTATPPALPFFFFFPSPFTRSLLSHFIFFFLPPSM